MPRTHLTTDKVIKILWLLVQYFAFYILIVHHSWKKDLCILSLVVSGLHISAFWMHKKSKDTSWDHESKAKVQHAVKRKKRIFSLHCIILVCSNQCSNWYHCLPTFKYPPCSCSEFSLWFKNKIQSLPCMIKTMTEVHKSDSKGCASPVSRDIPLIKLSVWWQSKQPPTEGAKT